MSSSTRVFTASHAVRVAVPLHVGLTGPSGSGKTKSALRLAEGMRRVVGGKIHVIDTENGRALHYADDHNFQHIPFEAPFSPLDYLAAIEFCVRDGAGVIVIDSGSHEHEGPGGVLEWHDRELEALGGRQSRTFEAWGKPKAARRRLINELLRLRVNTVWCFRAKEKLKIVKGKDPVPLGWQAIAGEEFIFEMTMHAIMLPGADGVPTWRAGAEYDGEKASIKLPQQFRNYFAEARQFDEQAGAFMAEWARGAVPPHPLVARYRDCSDALTFERLEAERKAAWSAASVADKQALKTVAETTKARLTTEQAPAVSDEQPDGEMSREESLDLDRRLADEQQML